MTVTIRCEKSNDQPVKLTSLPSPLSRFNGKMGVVKGFRKMRYKVVVPRDKKDGVDIVSVPMRNVVPFSLESFLTQQLLIVCEIHHFVLKARGILLSDETSGEFLDLFVKRQTAQTEMRVVPAVDGKAFYLMCKNVLHLFRYEDHEVAYSFLPLGREKGVVAEVEWRETKMPLCIEGNVDTICVRKGKRRYFFANKRYDYTLDEGFMRLLLTEEKKSFARNFDILLGFSSDFACEFDPENGYFVYHNTEKEQIYLSFQWPVYNFLVGRSPLSTTSWIRLIAASGTYICSLSFLDTGTGTPSFPRMRYPVGCKVWCNLWWEDLETNGVVLSSEGEELDVELEDGATTRHVVVHQKDCFLPVVDFVHLQYAIGIRLVKDFCKLAHPKASILTRMLSLVKLLRTLRPKEAEEWESLSTITVLPSVFRETISNDVYLESWIVNLEQICSVYMALRADSLLKSRFDYKDNMVIVNDSILVVNYDLDPSLRCVLTLFVRKKLLGVRILPPTVLGEEVGTDVKDADRVADEILKEALHKREDSTAVATAGLEEEAKEDGNEVEATTEDNDEGTTTEDGDEAEERNEEETTTKENEEATTEDIKEEETTTKENEEEAITEEGEEATTKEERKEETTMEEREEDMDGWTTMQRRRRVRHQTVRSDTETQQRTVYTEKVETKNSLPFLTIESPASSLPLSSSPAFPSPSPPLSSSLAFPSPSPPLSSSPAPPPRLPSLDVRKDVKAKPKRPRRAEKREALNRVKERIRQMLVEQIDVYKTVPTMINESGLLNLEYVSTLGAIKRLVELHNLGSGEDQPVSSVLEGLFEDKLLRTEKGVYLPTTDPEGESSC